WLTASLVMHNITEINAKSFCDLGSYPFFVPLIIRDYFGFAGELTVTTNLDLSAEGFEFLKGKNIQTAKLDLDPFVSDPSFSGDKLPTSINQFGNSFDLILSSHVIEHLYHPKTITDECARL